MTQIDVLMSVYNCEKHIEDTVKSIQSQTLSDIRIIIVDDGSTDKTGEIIQALASKDSRIEYHRQNNAGIVSALNNGLQYCTSPYIARHDGDDISYPDRFQKELDYLEANPNCVAVSGSVRNVYAFENNSLKVPAYFHPDRFNPYSIPPQEPHISQPMLMLRKSALLECGGYRNFDYAEDADLYWGLKNIGQLHSLNEILGDYRIHSHSISSQSKSRAVYAAIWSVLGALSEQRRIQGKIDIHISNELRNTIKETKKLSEIEANISPFLEQSEMAWFVAAVCAKYLAICRTRKIETGSARYPFLQIYNYRNNNETITAYITFALLEKGLIRGIRYMLDSRNVALSGRAFIRYVKQTFLGQNKKNR